MNNILQKIKKNVKNTFINTKNIILKNLILSVFFIIGLPLSVLSLDSQASFYEIFSSSFYGLSISFFTLLIISNLNLLFDKNNQLISMKNEENEKINYNNVDDNKTKTNYTINKIKEQIKEHEKIRK